MTITTERVALALNVTTNQTDLFAGLTFVTGSIPTRPPVPILTGIVIEGRGDHMLLSAFDYDNASIYRVAGAGHGKAIVSGKLLKDLIKDLDKGCAIHMSINGGGKVEVTGDGVTYSLAQLPVDEYPNLPELADPQRITILDRPGLDRLGDVLVAASKDDTLPALCGANMEVTNGSLSFTATDRYRLAMWEPEARVVGDMRFTIARSTLSLALKSFGKLKDAAMQIDVDGDLIRFSDDTRTIIGRRQDGEYPRIRSLFPAEYSTVAVMNSAELTKGIKQVAKVAERNTPVRISIQSDTATLEAGQGEDAQATKTITAAVIGDPMTTAFNPGYLLDGIAAVGGTLVELSLTASSKPGVLRDPSRPDMRWLQMPVRLAG